MSKPDVQATGGGPISSMDCVVGLGSNLGDRLGMLREAAQRVAALGELRGSSRVYENPPLGPAQPDFLNGALRVVVESTPELFLDQLLSIERSLGRVRRERWGPRVIDLDLLWIAGVQYHSPRLTVPHPCLTERAFAILPLLDLVPDAVDPTTKQPYRELLPVLDTSVLTCIDPLQPGSW